MIDDLTRKYSNEIQNLVAPQLGWLEGKSRVPVKVRNLYLQVWIDL